MFTKDAFDIEVTQSDIDNGTRNSIYFCPIARAITRTFELSERRVNVASFIETPAITCHFSLDSNSHIKKFINNFDLGKKVEPFKFNLFDLQVYLRR